MKEKRKNKDIQDFKLTFMKLPEIKWTLNRGSIVLTIMEKVNNSILKEGNLLYILQPTNC